MREWPIVLYEGQILDGRNRDAIAFELWQQTKREDLVPAFVEFVPDDDARGDEAALLYVQQRLSATRNLREGERVAAAYKLFRLYRDSRTRSTPAEGGRDRHAQRSASARAAAEVAGVSPRSIERYAYVDQHAGEALGAERAQVLLEAVDCGDVTVRAAERWVKAGLARLETARRAEQLAVVGTETPTDVPACAGEVILEAPGVKLVQVDALTLLRSLSDGCVETVFFDGPYVLGDAGTTNKGGERVPVSTSACVTACFPRVSIHPHATMIALLRPRLVKPGARTSSHERRVSTLRWAILNGPEVSHLTTSETASGSAPQPVCHPVNSRASNFFARQPRAQKGETQV